MESRLEWVEGRVAELEKRINLLQETEGKEREGLHIRDPYVTRMQIAALAAGYRKSGFEFRRVSADYYDKSLEERRSILGAPTTDHLCKTIVLENKACVTDSCEDKFNSKYYLLVQQYCKRLNGQNVARLIKGLSNEDLSMKHFEFRLAGDVENLTGFIHNAVTVIGSRNEIPVILSDSIVNELPEGTPRAIWLGGGQVDLKWQVSIDELIAVHNPIIGKLRWPAKRHQVDFCLLEITGRIANETEIAGLVGWRLEPEYALRCRVPSVPTGGLSTSLKSAVATKPLSNRSTTHSLAAFQAFRELGARFLVMCGRFSLLLGETALLGEARASRFEARNRFVSRADVRPTTQVPVLVRAKDGVRELRCMRWGLVAPWTSQRGGDQKVPPVINARSEEIESKPMFRNALKRGQRCVIYTTGYYEWKTDHTAKTPYLISYERNSRSLRIAGIWECNTSRDNEEDQEQLFSFSLITVACSKELEWLHHRMPVVIDSDEEEEAWLGIGGQWRSLFRSFESKGTLTAQLRTRDLTRAAQGTKDITDMFRSKSYQPSAEVKKVEFDRGIGGVKKDESDTIPGPSSQKNGTKRKSHSLGASPNSKPRTASQKTLTSFFN